MSKESVGSTLSDENLERVFKTYDIRGIDRKEIDELFFFAIGYVVGKKNKSVVIGHDHRKNSEKYAKFLIKGLNSSGVIPKSLSLVPTFLVPFSVAVSNFSIGLYITASHNPPEYNGLKMYLKDKVTEKTDWEEIKQDVKNYRDEIISEFKRRKEENVNYEKIEILEKYLELLKGKFQFNKTHKISIDCSNGPMSIFAENIYGSFGIKIYTSSCNLDPNFSSHDPDPSKEGNLLLLKNNIQKNKTEVGIAFDGDGDRAIFLDENGVFIPGDKATYVLSLYYKNPKIILDVKSSASVIKSIEKNGGKVILEKVGGPFIRKRLMQENFDFGGEYSGHYYFRNLGYDDPVFASLILLSVIEKHGSLSEIIKQIPNMISSEEYRIYVPEDKKYEIINKAKERFSKYKKIDIDGVRIEIDDGWFLIRPSNTEPKISLRFEAESKETYQKIKKMIESFLKENEIEVVL